MFFKNFQSLFKFYDNYFIFEFKKIKQFAQKTELLMEKT